MQDYHRDVHVANYRHMYAASCMDQSAEFYIIPTQA
jgi:hypothetical protein